MREGGIRRVRISESTYFPEINALQMKEHDLRLICSRAEIYQWQEQPSHTDHASNSDHEMEKMPK